MRLFLREALSAEDSDLERTVRLREREPFREADAPLARAVAARTDEAPRWSVARHHPALEAAGLAAHFTLVSTGGGAMLDFLAGRRMPGSRR